MKMSSVMVTNSGWVWLTQMRGGSGGPLTVPITGRTASVVYLYKPDMEVRPTRSVTWNLNSTVDDVPVFGMRAP